MRTTSPDNLPDGSLTIEQVLRAYGFVPGQFKDVTAPRIGIGSLGGGLVQQDIDQAAQRGGWPVPKIEIRLVGGAQNDPTDQDACVENSLDLQLVAGVVGLLTGRAADICFCIGPNDDAGMSLVTDELSMQAGCKMISWSWGAAASSWTPAARANLENSLESAVKLGCAVFAASGDNSIDDGTDQPQTDFPCSSVNCWAVGGTNLRLNPDGTIQLESAWGDGQPGDEGGGGGFDPTVPTPDWQKMIVPAYGIENPKGGRGVPDSAACADPNTGWQVCCNGSWTVVGGTSASCPMTAALCAVIAVGLAGRSGLLTPLAYQSTGGFRGVTTGSNGDAARVGWNPACGLGSPLGSLFIQAFQAVNPPA